MPVVSDLVPLLYRARWIRFSVSGEVRRHRERGGFDGHEELSGSLLAAPDGRYRVDLVDEDGDRQLMIYDGTSGGVPFRELLSPSWLLAEFDLQVTGETEHIGRVAYAVAASPRQAGSGRASPPADRVSVVVDAELGILLRYEKAGPGRSAETAEFTSLRVDAAEQADPLLFIRPPQTGPARGKPSPGGSLPAPERAGTSPALSDDQVNLLYRTTLGPQKFSAELYEWADEETMARLADAALSSTSLSRPTRWLRQSAEDDPAQAVELTALLQVAMPGSYRIEAFTDTTPKAACTACDGDRLWLVYSDRIVVRAAASPPAGISLIIDPAWLLYGYRLLVEGTATVSGRAALQLVAVPTGEALPQLHQGPLSGLVAMTDKIETTIDLELGIVLRQIWYFDSHPLLRTELAGVTEAVDLDAFRIEPPPGTRIITGGPLAEAGLTAAGAAWITAKGASKIAADIGRRWIRGPRP